MGIAFLQGFGAALSLVLGAVFALRLAIRLQLLGLIIAFGSGLLISSVAYELVAEALATSHGQGAVGIGLLAGAVTFFVGDELITRLGGGNRKDATGPGKASSAMAIVLGTVLDGIPESLVLGIGAVSGKGQSIAMWIAVFVSNIPEALASTTGLRSAGWSAKNLLLMWAGIALISGIAAAIGFGVFDDAPKAAVAFVLAFAGGALLTMLTDTMVPEAYEHAGPLAGLLTTIGFGAGITLAMLS